MLMRTEPARISSDNFLIGSESMKISFSSLVLLFIVSLLLPVLVHAVDFGISTSERSVTIGQNTFSSGFIQLIIYRNDFDGPIEVDMSVDPGGAGVNAYVNESRLLRGGNKKRSKIDIHVDAEKHAENGRYQVTVTAKGTVNGEKRTRVATFEVIVNRNDTFSIAVKPTHLILPQGDTTETNVEIVEFGKFNNPVSLAVSSEADKTLSGFDFSFSGEGDLAVATRSDVVTRQLSWAAIPDSNNKSVHQLTVITYPDTVPGEYIFYVLGRRDFENVSTRRAMLKVTVTADPDFIHLIEQVEFSITTEQTRMVVPPSGYPHMNEIYVTAERSLETIKLKVSLEPDTPGISVGLSNRRIKPGGANMLFIAVTEEARPGTYYATITATSRGSNNKTRTETTRVEIIVPEKKKAQDSQVLIGDEPKPVKVNCVGSSCPDKPIKASCLGASCQSPIDLNCSGSLCTENLDLICPDGNCPSSLDLNCDATECDTDGMNFFCGESSCFSQPGDGVISDLTSTLPSSLAVNCTGQGCDSTDIIGLCYGGSCPSSINLNCTGTSCTNVVELNCTGGTCSEDFNYDCSGDSCSSQLQFDCDGYICDELDSFPSGKPYLTGAAPSSNILSTAGATPSTTSTESSAEIKPVVTPKGSSEVIPASNADLAVLQAAADSIAANAGACLSAECPIIDCDTAGILLQGLINAEANLDEMYKWLIQASDDAMAHLLSLQANDILTTEQLSQAITAQGLHQFLHDLGSTMLDLAAIGETLKGVKEGDLNDASALKKLDTAYETLKDMESTASTLGKAYEIDVPTRTSDLPGAVIGVAGGDAIPDATGSKNATPDNIGSAINDVKSQVNDAIDMVQAVKEGKSPVSALGKMIGRIVKTISAAKLEERQALIDGYMKSLGENASAIASSIAFLQKANNRRFAAEDALKAVRAAKNALMACMAKACGATSLTRPNVTSGFKGWGSALRHFNGMMQSLFSGMNGSFDVKDQCPGTETAVSLFTGDGFIGGGGISVGGNTTLTPSHTVEAKCPRCQSIADKLAVNLTETDYWRAEKSAIEEKLRQAETLRERMKVLERRKASNRRGIANMSEGLRNANAFGFNWGPGLAIMLREAEARGRDLQRQIQEMEREIARLEADKNRLETIQSRLSELAYKRRGLREDLRYCEEQYCKDYDKDNAAVGRLFGELFAVEVIDVKNVSGNNPFNQQDPISQESDSGNEATVKVINNIPISRLSLAGADVGCPNPNGNHYHGSAKNCNGVVTADPAPGACGHGRVTQVSTIAVSSCPDL
jgi:hypothetical protein